MHLELAKVPSSGSLERNSTGTQCRQSKSRRSFENPPKVREDLLFEQTRPLSGAIKRADRERLRIVSGVSIAELVKQKVDAHQ
jgi:hypothetical protein